ncbi:branched-chain amino acid ABC transporter permease [Agrobacterium pusense]|uniref:branched-chain amino acid ABC transporter permease n=1 Tax=Agrobacterium pusense TaxID=648995 RepID=UPI003FD6992C
MDTLAKTIGSAGTMPEPAESDAQTRSVFWILITIAGALSLTFLLPGFRLFQGSMIFAYAITLMGLNILAGFSGQVSLGHGAFFALGAYCSAILMEHAGLPYWIVVPGAGMVGFAAGYAFGWPALRLTGIYLGLTTFALAVATPQVLKYHALEDWTGGSMGLFLAKPVAPFDLPLTEDQWMYVYTLLLAAIVFGVARSLLRSATGRALRATRDNPLAAEAIGIDTRHHKVIAFGLSAACAALGGALAAVNVQFVAPDAYDLFLSMSLLVGAVVGGIATLGGAFIGAAFIVFIPTLADSISKSAPWAIYGVVLLVLVYTMPEGLGGAMSKLARPRKPRK